MTGLERALLLKIAAALADLIQADAESLDNPGSPEADVIRALIEKARTASV
ncbi:hypothetical protein [Plastoroseomonas hellenica]|uniref:hypothetical protein n=1 Tax=Plastoroseomonas hellenica TaxID=2687306 RepID=UPI001BAC198B|nr:hypothetical protein [Plastoroseomonas hellenica]MBR0641406.1 hypothetical protein [Plastoroseomonas hellenica]